MREEEAAFRRRKTYSRADGPLWLISYSLYPDGIDVREAALVDRKRAPRQLLANACALIQHSDHFAVSRGGSRVRGMQARICEAEMPFFCASEVGMSSPPRKAAGDRHPYGMGQASARRPPEYGVPDANADGETPVDIGIAYLLKEVAAGHAYIAIARTCQDAVVVRANLQSALRVLQAVDRHLAHSLRNAAGSRKLRAARDDLHERLAQGMGQLKSIDQRRVQAFDGFSTGRG